MSYNVLLYYYYTPLDDYNEYFNLHKTFCNKYDFKGRIIIAKGGINGTLSGNDVDCKAYINFIYSDNRFRNLEFKIDKCDSHCFPKLSIKLRDEIVSLKVPHLDPNITTGKNISPKKFLEMIKHHDTVLVDV
ncbi:hypothetical protein CPAV1605_1359 [seawater metagenome]|uniref:tRNA uridine(34) hydroxylase N-terminal domain-containing protein n=1 Tax=seawater metagenome TaxID=1561972 RepID=A0A5E8CKK4_9ZZZZ